MILAALLLLAVQDALPPADKPLHDAVTAAIRNCPQSKGDEIAVCAEDRGFSEKYRMEKLNRPQPPAEDSRLSLSGVANTGSTVPGTCTSASSVGTPGCSKRDYDDWAAWKRKQKAEGDQAFPW